MDLILILIFLGVIITVAWWIKTTKLIIKLSQDKLVESKLLDTIIADIKEIKQNIRENLHQKN